MPATDELTDTAHGGPPPADLLEAGVYRTPAEGFEHGLVVLAFGWPYWLEPGEGGFRLLVEPAAFASVREQLEKFDRESAGWPPPAEPAAPAAPVEIATPLLWLTAVFVSFDAQARWPGWTRLGAVDPQAMFRHGEWWRPFTALFLHADIGHLVSNALGGLLVFAALVSTIGRARGWALLALAAVAGNLAAAALHYPEEYRSVGASTAIFAALGLLTGRAVRVALRSGHPHRWRGLFVPLASGFAVLGLFGAGGVQIDVLAHATGFAAGLLLGFFAGLEPRRPA
ncbi:MAG TPA: rhomboid family intramembrane serine protease [Opitutus sp.]|nr:rhomboid family intramembrane serine protease [Opitutus sp.]